MTPQDPPRQDATRQIGDAVNPVLVTERRGELIESVHRGAFAICDASGAVIAGHGDVAALVYPRSAIKPIQALPLVESAAADAFGLSDIELTLACASHNSEPRQVSAIAAWLTRIGCRERDLVCGPHAPAYPPAAEALVRERCAPTRLHHNCSGKHTGFLTQARQLGVPTVGYDAPGHPVQQRVIQALSALAGVAPASLKIAIDGCGAPNFALPLQNLATAFARIADPLGLAPARRAAIERLTGAVRAQPYFIAGTGRLCTRIIESGASVIPKAGAEGVYVAALPDLKLGLALKIDDGAKRAAECLLVALLAGVGALKADGPLAREYASSPVVNTQGRVVGQRIADFDAIAKALKAS
jgi:L-asparaginase II